MSDVPEATAAPKPKKVKKPRKKLGGGSNTKCQNCGKNVYPADKQMNVEGKLWHMGCFKCSYPGHDSQLTLRDYTIAQGHPYCKTHCACYPSALTPSSRDSAALLPPLRPPSLTPPLFSLWHSAVLRAQTWRCFTRKETTIR